MEPITHILAGACISRATLKSKTALSTVTMVIAAEIADVDLLYSLRGPVVGFQHHRGWTHSVAAMPLMAALSLALVWVWYRLFPRKIFNRIAPAALDRPRMPVRWVLLYGYACLAALSHLLLDYTTSYGIRLFEPFSFKWYSWDIVYMAEPFMWVVLGLGLAVPGLLGLVYHRRRSYGFKYGARSGAIFALLAIVLMCGFRDYQHRDALAELNMGLWDGRRPVRSSAYPYPWNPFFWHGVVETSDSFETVEVNTLDGGVSPADHSRAYYKPKETAVTTAAKQSNLGRLYLDWARYPVIETTVEHNSKAAYRVRFYDLRSIHRLYGSVDLDTNLGVVMQRFGRQGHD
jgi:inner membrane protein